MKAMPRPLRTRAAAEVNSATSNGTRRSSPAAGEGAIGQRAVPPAGREVHEVLLGQLGEANPALAGQRVPRRGDEDQRLLAQRLQPQAGRRLSGQRQREPGQVRR